MLMYVGLHQTAGDGVFFVQSQIRQQVEVEKKEEVAMEMSDLVVYCQPRSKEKDRFGKDTQVPMKASDVISTGFPLRDLGLSCKPDILCDAQIKDLFFYSFVYTVYHYDF